MLYRRYIAFWIHCLWHPVPGYLLCFCAALLGLSSDSSALAQSIAATARETIDGSVVSVTNHSLEVRLDDGQLREIFFQDKDVKALTLGGDRVMVRLPAEIKVTGELPVRLLRKGLALEAVLELQKGGNASVVESLKLLPVDFDDLSVEFLDDTDDQQARAIVRGVIVRLANSKIYLKVPKSRFLSRGGIIIPVESDSTFHLEDDSMHEAAIGDRIHNTEVYQFSTGEWIAKTLNLTFGGEHTQVQNDPDDQLQIKYRHLDDRPTAPRELRSDHFVIKTDLSDRSSQILLDKLETMYKIIGKYYNRRNLGQPIFCYVADDLEQWKDSLQELAPGMESIVGNAGVTVALVGARNARVYSCGSHDVVQHEAVHAFCHLGFGSTGPTWYSEGMAELGCYWRPGDEGVNIDPVVIRYLTSTNPTPLVEIVAPGQITGDSWRAYAWRWALCYMLVNNPNYNRRFYALGDAMMRPNSRANFYAEFADVASEISFEYRQFTRELGNGYQQQLCSWDWKTKAVSLNSGRSAKKKIAAGRGWQATSAKLESGETYESFARGSWSIDGTNDVGPDGSEKGEGRLIGAILYEKTDSTGNRRELFLSETFELGTETEFTASHDGHLFVRCNEKMTGLADNTGEVQFVVRRKK